jgi:hypothetical protein
LSIYGLIARDFKKRAWLNSDSFSI